MVSARCNRPDRRWRTSALSPKQEPDDSPKSNSAAGLDRFELRDECTAGPKQHSAEHGKTAAHVAKESR